MALMLPILMVGFFGFTGAAEVLFSINGATYSAERALTTVSIAGNNPAADTTALATLGRQGLGSTNLQKVASVKIFRVDYAGGVYTPATGTPPPSITYTPSGSSFSCGSTCSNWPAANRPTATANASLVGITITYQCSVLWGMGGPFNLSVTRYGHLEPQS